jgi:recombination protein RecA
MSALPRDVTATLAALQARWGNAAPRTVGALATAPVLAPAPGSIPGPGESARPGIGSGREIISTGFAALDAILGPGGIPRGTSLALRGAASSGTTTLALRLVGEAQAAGLIAAWLDLSSSLDPVEAIARGVSPEWLLVITPGSPDEGLALSGSLLSGRVVDLLVVDLPMAGPPGFGERLGRLAAMARRIGALLVVLEPPGLPAGLSAAAGDATGLRLELERQAWIRLGRDVIGQRTAVTVARSRIGPPGRRAELRILYAEGGGRDACLRQDGLLRELLPAAPPGDAASGCSPGRSASRSVSKAPAFSRPGISQHAPPSPLLAPPAPGPRASSLRLVPAGAGGGGGSALDSRERPGREPGGPGSRRPSRDAARVGAPSGP